MRHLYLIGNMGSGKTTVGKLLAERWNLPLYDIDHLVEQETQLTIPEIFQHHGEPRFRELESAILHQVARQPRGVVATGGGIVLSEANRALMRQTGWMIYLKASPETLWKRLRQSRDRPLLQTASPLETLQAVMQAREPLYQEADWVIEVDPLTPAQTADAVASVYYPTPEAPLSISVLANQPYGYRVRIAPGILSRAAQIIPQHHRPTRVALLTHPRLMHRARLIQTHLDESGISAYLICLRSGERMKSLRTVERLYGQLLQAGLDRNSLLITLGGGVLGDLGGFVAATYMRGIPYMQLPTTLLAQVDSSVGGKVAVDLPQGKNLVGAFYQPVAVLIDPETLQTLPARHWRNGFAEMLKYGIALHRGLWKRLLTMLEGGILHRKRVNRDASAWLLPIAQCVNLKAQIVSEDERDLSGRRALLNFGHTIGHAIEAALGYREWLHGEAIAAGMVAEAELGRILGITPDEVADTLRTTVAQAGLPTHIPTGVGAETLLELMRHDKKRVGDALSVVLLRDIGIASLEPNIPTSAVREALKRCGAS
ncbi:MAG: 3-dehydroquinate synthase [Armatimonadetes bacterium CP1_7O]|nr:MAG: 3-dehydroquinate synthase [Armatimonadetes bacterium CP1_7O]